MSKIAVKMKWTKEIFDLEIDTAAGVEALRSKIYSLTRVPTDRQKLMLPGGPLKEGEDLSKRKVKPGMTVMLVGTAEGGELKAPEEKIKFVEDMTPEELAAMLKEKKQLVPPAGLENLGNTCYANSVIQSLNRIKPWKEGLEDYLQKNLPVQNIDGQFTKQLGYLGRQLGNTTGKVVPNAFIMAMKQRFPHFAETGPNGAPKQQDAEEFLTGLLNAVHGAIVDNATNRSLVDELFGFQMKGTLKCLEAEDEESTSMDELKRVLLCHLGTPTEPVSMLHRGVELSLKEHVEKTSPTLGRTAQYEKTSAMETLPPYLVVQFARFQWKAKNEEAGTDASRTKVTRKCAFQQTMDVFDYASENLKEELMEGRRRKKKLDDIDFEEAQSGKVAMDVDDAKKGDAATGSAAGLNMDVDKKASNAAMEVDDEGELTEIQKKDFIANGSYKLIAVVSHAGRTADGGHYVAWGKIQEADMKEEKFDTWARYDDDEVDFCDTNHGAFKDLVGGKADSQVAYLVIYQKQTIKKLTPEENRKAQLVKQKQEAEDAERFKKDNKAKEKMMQK